MIQPRKSPLQKRSAAMVGAILEAAARILEEGGLGQLTTNAVAQRAGVSVGSLYQYFPSKESIIAELIRMDHDGLLAGLQRIASGPRHASLKDMVRAMVDVGAAHQLQRPGLSRALDYVEPMLPLDKEAAEIEQAINALIVGLLRSHAPRLKGKMLNTAAADIAALARSMIDAAGRRGETSPRIVAERVTRAIMGYLSPYV